MKFSLIINVLTILLLIIAAFMLIPAGIALYYGEITSLWSFIIPILILLPLAALSYF